MFEICVLHLFIQNKKNYSGNKLEIIILSDIHANLEALQAVSDDIHDLPIYCAGDIVNYGANPKEVIQWLKKRNAKSILGNHDYAIVNEDTNWFNSKAEVSINWTSKNLDSASKKYLSSLQESIIVKINNLKMLIVHGSPIDNLFEYVYPATHEHLFDIYLKKFNVDIIVMGHTHIPFIWKRGNDVVMNPGSVGQPRSGNNKASYIILKQDNKNIEVELKLISYDIETAAKKIKESGLPLNYAERLFKGI